jgi:hypothetical protein
MHFKTFGITFLVAVIYCTSTDASGQAGFEGPTPCARASRLERNVHCDEAQTGKTLIIESEVIVTTRVEGITLPTRQCQAEVSLGYAQNNTTASVEGKISNATCGESSGSLVLSVRTANERGELTTQEFTQSWMREDDQPVTFSSEYPIGENVDLARHTPWTHCLNSSVKASQNRKARICEFQCA